jgi:hypothetical protein
MLYPDTGIDFVDFAAFPYDTQYPIIHSDFSQQYSIFLIANIQNESSLAFLQFVWRQPTWSNLTALGPEGHTNIRSLSTLPNPH